MKDIFRQYGAPPYQLVLVHGGPGGAGEMAPLARELSANLGVLEPLQNAYSVEGQIEELQAILHKFAQPPLTLLGFSWGAWLVTLTAARYPDLAQQLILVGSGPFQEKYKKGIMETRLSRLNNAEKEEVISLIARFNSAPKEEAERIFARMGRLLSRADAYDALDEDPSEIRPNGDIYDKVWPEAAAMRASGELLEEATRIQCPVFAIHGAYDPHPASGVKEPLTAVLDNFQFILLENCGHKPWIERQAKARFFSILQELLATDSSKQQR